MSLTPRGRAPSNSRVTAPLPALRWSASAAWTSGASGTAVGLPRLRPGRAPKLPMSCPRSISASIGQPFGAVNGSAIDGG